MASALQTLTDIVPALGDEDIEVRLAAIRELEPQVLTEHADTIIPMLLGAGYIAAQFKVILIGKLEPHMFEKYAEDIILGLGNGDLQVWCCVATALCRLEPHVIARYAGEIVPFLGLPCKVSALSALEKVPLVALVPHRHALQFSEEHGCMQDSVASLRGRVWLVRWRQLFWCQRLLWWWGSLACRPGSRQARAAASEFGRMQGVSAEEEGEREVKRARVV